MRYAMITGMAILFAMPPGTYAQGVLGKAAREAAEYAAKKFGREVAEEGAERLAGRIAAAAARHGDDAIKAVGKVGPRALSLADEAGEHAPMVMRLLARHGDDAARVLAHPQGMAIVARFGDDAAEMLIKHHGIAEPLVERIGQPAVQALGAVGTKNGRRLAMMADAGELAAIGRSDELLQAVARHGDRACDFVYRNRGMLAGSAALAAFLANPEPFLDGAKDLSQIAVGGANDMVATVADGVVKPAAIAAGHAAGETIRFLATLLFIVILAAAGVVGWAVSRGLHEHPVAKAAGHALVKRLRKLLPARG